MFDIYIRYHDNLYDLHVLHLSYVIHVCIYLSIDKRELSIENTEPVLLQMSKGKIVFWQIVFWHIFCLKNHGIVYVLEQHVSIHIPSKKLFQDIQQTTYSTHIYLICIVYVHISWCHNYPYHFLVHIQAGEIATSTTDRLSECVAKACNKKQTSEAECDAVKKQAWQLKELLVPGVEVCDDKLVDLVTEIEDYKKSMQVAKQQMKASTSAYILSTYDFTDFSVMFVLLDNIYWYKFFHIILWKLI